MVNSLSISVLAAGTALCLVLGANNIAICIGTTMSSRTLRYKQAVLIAAVGLMAGAVLEGGKMSQTVAGVAPTLSDAALLAATIAAFAVMALVTWLRIPLSMNQVFVGAVVGATLARAGVVDVPYTGLVITSWLLTPVAGLVAATLISLVTRAVARRIRRIILLNKAYAWLTIVTGFYASYALGANGIGLVAGASNTLPQLRPWVVLGMAAAAVAGMALFGRGTTRSVAENIVGLNMPAAMAAQLGGAMVVHGFTQVGMPVSSTQAVVGGVFGAAAPRKLVVQNSRLIRELILGWSAAPLVGAIIAFALASVL
ncbi:MAG: inorganic phosphate transporter [Candidatus Bathyarchaeia archaeon]